MTTVPAPDATGQAEGPAGSFGGDPPITLSVLLFGVLGYTEGEFVAICDDAGTFSSTVVAASDAEKQLCAAPQDANVFFGVNPIAGPARTSEGRGMADDVTRLAALVADLDVKQGACTDLAAAEAVIDELSGMLGTRPSAITHSGHGMHPYWAVDNGTADTAMMAATLNRWGRLVKVVAEAHGAKADSVFDLPRVLRAPGTFNNKHRINGCGAVAVHTYEDSGAPLTLAEIDERLDEFGIYRADEDGDTREALSDPADWEFAETTCPYVGKLLDGLADDGPLPGNGRHQWLCKQSVRLYCAVMLGCITEADYERVRRILSDRLHALRAATNEKVPRCEIPGAWQFGIDKAATKTPDEARAELGAHRHTDDINEEAFWSSRPILKHICESSLARQMDPRGVLAVHLARAVCSIPPYVTLPGTTGSRASLNLHVALVGPSSGGKSSSVAVAREAIGITPEPEVTSLGSGEGLAKQYAYRKARTNEIVTLTDTLLFNDTEIESVEALAKRTGNPLMSQWRKTFTGEQLGFGYADPKHRIPVMPHKYRFCQIIGIQPELAGWLLGGTQAAGGTPQRILWAPVVYPTMPPPGDLPEWPGQQILPAWPRLKATKRLPKGDNGEGTFALQGYRKAVDEPADPDMLTKHELKLPAKVEALVRDARTKFHHGEVDELAGHSTLTRLKVAAALMWLDGRTDAISVDDWELAGTVMKISDRTREEVRATLADKEKRANTAHGRAQGQRKLAEAEVLGDAETKAVERVGELIVTKLNDQDGQGLREIKRAIAKRDRHHVDAAVDLLHDDGRIRREKVVGTNGQEGERLWLI